MSEAPIEVGLRQPATTALVEYLNDHFSVLSFNAYLWTAIVIAQYGGGPSSDEQPASKRPSLVDEMDKQTQFLGQMMLCRGVDSFLVYISHLLVVIFTAEPNILKSNEKVSLEFVLDHLRADDLVQAAAIP